LAAVDSDVWCGDPVEFRILGPVEVTVGPERLELGGARQRIVLATLLLNPDTVVTAGRLETAIYGEDPPLTSRSQVHISISALRRLFASKGHAATITTREQGYVLEIGDGQLDSQRFDALVAGARAARNSGQADLAVANYRDALRLWRGPALEGIDSQSLQATASRLDEQRIVANEERIELELDLGRHHELVGELAELVAGFPLRERLRGQLMLALYRCGRQADALAVYRQTRHTLIDELGIEPGERLRRLEQAILACDPGLDAPAEPVVVHAVRRPAPGLLPANIGDFTGRVEYISEIRRCLLPSAGTEARVAVPIVVITGKGGVGKTSLAVHASHGLAGQFPDGQLFADLHGASAHPVDPMDVLGRFLRALGVPGAQLPDGLDERAEVYRNLLAGRRVLVVLDDSAGERQASPLLPGSATAAVIVTSRRRLGGLAVASRIELDVLDSDQSVNLLARIAGGRVHAQPEAAVSVAASCGHLPLALRIAGARLASLPHWSVQQLAERLADQARRLDELRHGALGIRASISVTYEGSSEQARRLLRRLAVLDAPVFSGWVSAALLDQPVVQAQDLLDELLTANLVETTGTGAGAHSQYRLHELIRIFARERLAAEEPATVQAAALERALGGLLHLAGEAHQRHYGGDYVRLESDASQWPLPKQLVEQLVSDPLSWYERERAALVSGVRQAARAGLTELCWSLAFGATTLFEARAYHDDWRETHDVALAAMRTAQHARGQAAVLYSLGTLYLTQMRLDLADRAFSEAAQLFRDARDDRGTALVHSEIASLDRMSGRLEDATRGYGRALAMFREAGDHAAAAYALKNLSRVKLDSGELDAARELLADALDLARTARAGRIEAQVLNQLGEAYLLAGDATGAVAAFESALVKVRSLGDPIGEAWVLRGAGIAKTRLGEFGPARRALLRAAELASTTGDRLAEARTLLALSELALASGDPARAIVLCQRASETFRDRQAPVYAADALTALGEAHAAAGDRAATAEVFAQVAALRAKPAAPRRSTGN
jgi:DNA-binding SARP family transcriptional activator